MQTKLVLSTFAVGENGAPVSEFEFVNQTFEEVLEKIAPLSQPSSALEARQTCIYTVGPNEHQRWIPPSQILRVYENWEEDEET